MQKLRVAVATGSFGQPIRQALQTAADMGAEGVLIDARSELKPTELSATGRREFLHQLSEIGLQVAALGFSARRSYYDPDQLDGRLAATRAAMEFAYELKARVLVIRAGRVPDDDGSRENQLLAEVLNDLARHGNRVGVTVAITPSRDDPARLAQLLGRVTDGPIGVNFDPAAFLMAGHNPSGAFRTLHGHVVHVTVRDALRDMDGGGREVAIGRGEVDWDEFAALLDEADYRGWLTVERTGGEDKVRDTARAVQYLRQLRMG